MMRLIPFLLSRLTIGWIFIESGLGKLGKLEDVVSYFESLGIPFAQLQAPFVSVVELVAGLCVLLGLGTRLAALPLVGTMVVAIATAQRESIERFSDLLGLSEFLYIVVLVWLIAMGAGGWSVDEIVKSRWKTRSRLSEWLKQKLIS